MVMYFGFCRSKVKVKKGSTRATDDFNTAGSVQIPFLGETFEATPAQVTPAQVTPAQV